MGITILMPGNGGAKSKTLKENHFMKGGKIITMNRFDDAQQSGISVSPDATHKAKTVAQFRTMPYPATSPLAIGQTFSYQPALRWTVPRRKRLLRHRKGHQNDNYC